MRTLKTILGLAVASAIVSCDMNDEHVQRNLSNQIAGIYNGTLTSTISQTAVPATAEITSVSSNTIQIHCFCADLDTTLVLDLYPDGNMLRVCLTGDDFMKEYGHGMSGGDSMMGNMAERNWTWQQHMNHEHNSNDKHYGYFDLNARTFDYTFDFRDMQVNYSQHFSGKR